LAVVVVAAPLAFSVQLSGLEESWLLSYSAEVRWVLQFFFPHGSG
jgi:hypothetical protein